MKTYGRRKGRIVVVTRHKILNHGSHYQKQGEENTEQFMEIIKESVDRENCIGPEFNLQIPNPTDANVLSWSHKASAE